MRMRIKIKYGKYILLLVINYAVWVYITQDRLGRQQKDESHCRKCLQYGETQDKDTGMTHRNTGMTDNDTGMTDKDTGMTDKDTGMTDKDTGMTDKDTGMTDNDTGMTDRNQEKLDTDKTSDKWLAKMKERMDKRKKTIRDVCNANNLRGNLTDIIWSRKGRLWFLIVSDTHRLMYAYVSKVGSTNWKSAFLVLKGKYAKVEDVPGKRAHDPSLKKLSGYTPEEIEFRLRNYTKFLFVRHPFSRVLSAYRSKLERNNPSFRKKFGRVIMERFHPEAPQSDIRSGAKVSFKDFVNYVYDNRTKYFDGHWQVISSVVFPCDIQYDYIGQLESSYEDSEYILKQAKVDHLIHFKNTSVDSIKSHERSVFHQYYKNISTFERQQLYNVYKNDFRLFGYERDNLPNY